MSLPQAAPVLVNIRLHPIKSLDPVYVPEAHISRSGGLELDRAWALHSVDGKWVNGKRTPAIHLIRANYSPDLRSVTLSVPGDRREIPTRTFASLAATKTPPNGSASSSSSRSSSATPRTASPTKPSPAVPRSCPPLPCKLFLSGFPATPQGFPGIGVDEVRERFRATLEINGVPAFWEDQLFGQEERSVVRFKIGEVNFEGSHPCARCPVPPRNPRTGEILEGFQKFFTQLRQSTLPSWSPRDRFDHFYRLSTNTRVSPTETSKLLRRRPLHLA